jgi:hypothetical protein
VSRADHTTAALAKVKRREGMQSREVGGSEKGTTRAVDACALHSPRAFAIRVHITEAREQARFSLHAAAKFPKPGSIDGKRLAVSSPLMIYVDSSYVVPESCRRIESWGGADGE